MQNTRQRGQLRYKSDNPEGPNFEILMWDVQIQPDGDTALIGDDWAVMPFSGEILRYASKAGNEYMQIITGL